MKLRLNNKIKIKNMDILQQISDQIDLGDPEKVFDAYLILRHHVRKKHPDRFLQFENFLFYRPDYEIKLSRQFGKTSKYSFEVELINEKASLAIILKDLGLAKLVASPDVVFWKKWDREVNLTTRDLKEKNIKILIREYLPKST